MNKQLSSLHATDHWPLTTVAMSLLDSEAGKRRLLTIEIPVIERYNEGRDPAFRIRVAPRRRRAGAAATASNRGTTSTSWKPGWCPAIPTVPPETRVLTAAETLSAPAGRPDAVPVAAGQHAGHQPLGSGALHLHLRRPGGLALAGVL